MPILFDHDPLTGMTQWFDYDPINDTAYLKHDQDVSGFLDACKHMRSDEGAWKKGVKESWAHFASIPAIVEIELKNKGINIYDKNQTQRIIQEIEQNYPYLKTTEAKMWRPKKTS